MSTIYGYAFERNGRYLPLAAYYGQVDDGKFVSEDPEDEGVRSPILANNARQRFERFEDALMDQIDNLKLDESEEPNSSAVDPEDIEETDGSDYYARLEGLHGRASEGDSSPAVDPEDIEFSSPEDDEAIRLEERIERMCRPVLVLAKYELVPKKVGIQRDGYMSNGCFFSDYYPRTEEKFRRRIVEGRQRRIARRRKFST